MSLQVERVFPFLIEPDECVHNACEDSNNFFPECRGGVALERPIWKVTIEPGDRRCIAVMDLHEVTALSLLIARTRDAVTLLPRGYYTPGPLD